VGEDSPIANTRGIRNDVLSALQRLKMPNLRWPGGCFADTYHWKDGIGPRASRPPMINTHWGGTVENNHFGTHEFLDLCGMLGCEPYICGNVGSGTVQEMAQWLEYLTARGGPRADLRRKNGRDEPWPLTWWSVGNENNGCGGNMRPQYYADEYRRFQTYCGNHSGARLYKVACGALAEWNEIMMREAGPCMDGLSVHYYTAPVGVKTPGTALAFDENVWWATMAAARGIEAFMEETERIMDRHDPSHRVGLVLDEWGAWHGVEPGTNPSFLYQQNTVRDAVVAGMTLNIFNTHAARLHMANIAQLVNVLQAVALTDGPRMLLTPTFHVFEMYVPHQDATLLPMRCESEPVGGAGASTPRLSASASRDVEGRIHVSLVNLHPAEPAAIRCEIRGADVKGVRGRILTGPAMSSHNTFDRPNAVHPVAFDGAVIEHGALAAVLPARSVTMLELA
jgi:alpha-N-arabinofuranosidase